MSKSISPKFILSAFANGATVPYNGDAAVDLDLMSADDTGSANLVDINGAILSAETYAASGMSASGIGHTVADTVATVETPDAGEIDTLSALLDNAAATVADTLPAPIAPLPVADVPPAVLAPVPAPAAATVIQSGYTGARPVAASKKSPYAPGSFYAPPLGADGVTLFKNLATRVETSAPHATVTIPHSFIAKIGELTIISATGPDGVSYLYYLHNAVSAGPDGSTVARLADAVRAGIALPTGASILSGEFIEPGHVARIAAGREYRKSASANAAPAVAAV